MAYALKIRVDKALYQQTLNSLDSQLDALKSNRESLERQIGQLKSADTFGGSDVKSAIAKAEETLETVKDAISRVTGYRVAIDQQLSGVESAATQLQSDMSNIDLPNMFN